MIHSNIYSKFKVAGTLPMPDDLIAIVEESEVMNGTLISRVRLEILWALSELGEDGATARQLKGGLNLNDGVLYANLRKLVDMGYLRFEKVTLEGKELELYSITPEGLLEWERIRGWLCKLLGCVGDTCER
jgi:DNA-binding PadR family transcriptional regulator